MGKQKKNYIIIFLLSLLVGSLFVHREIKETEQDLHLEVRNLLSNQANFITNEVKASVDQVYFLRALVLGSKGQPRDLTAYGSTLMQGTQKTRNVLLAPNGIVSTVYPLAGNEAVLGLNLLGNENASAKAAQRAKLAKNVVLTGPYKLKQGGEALSGRLAVFLPDDKGTEKYWGLVSVSLDYPDAFSDTAVAYLEKNKYNFRLTKLEEGRKTPLLAYKAEAMVEPEEVHFAIYNMHFALEASPTTGWYNYNYFKQGIFWVVCFSLLLSLFLGKRLEDRNVWQKQATQDSLTGLYNRTAAFKIMDQLLRTKHYEKGAFIIIDIDNFKDVNDNFGHQIGDKVLMDFAQKLKNSCRDSDVVGRLGGDEFMMYLPFNSSEAFLRTKLEDLKKQLVNNIEYNGTAATITASIGVAIADEKLTDYRILYQKADEALYKVKSQGKDDIGFAAN